MSTTLVPTVTTGAAVDTRWPSPRRSHGIARLEDGRLLLVAGRTNVGSARTYLADSWEFDTIDRAWTPVGDDLSPRAQFALTDAGDGSALLMGGYVGGRFTYPGTWAYEDGWFQLQVSGDLTGRAGSAAAYDIDSDVVVLFGGAERPTVAELPTNETWLYDPETLAWTEVTPDVSPRPKSEGHPTLFELAMVYDIESDAIVLLIGGDETWVYDAETNTWDARTPPGLEVDFMIAAAYDVRLDRVVMYGGAPSESSNETWLYDTNADTWTRVETDVDPGMVGDHAMAYDPATAHTYLFGGARDLLPLNGIGDVKDELWAFDGSEWSRIGP